MLISRGSRQLLEAEAMCNDLRVHILNPIYQDEMPFSLRIRNSCFGNVMVRQLAATVHRMRLTSRGGNEVRA